MSERNVLKLDINGLTMFQKELHYPDDNNNPTDPKNRVNSRFSCTVEKNAWSTHTKAKMIHAAEENEVVYTASKKFDVLTKSEIHLSTIPIKVKDKLRKRVQICVPHNFGHNLPYQGELKVDDDHHQTLDSVWMDIHSQFYMKEGAGKREHYQRMVGNVPCLEDWNSELPGIKLVVPQPYYYARNTRVGLRTLRSSMNTVTHHYKIRNKIHEILRMRVRKDENEPWIEIPCVIKYLDIDENAKEFPVPELWARYSLMTDEERDWHKMPDPRTGEPVKHVIYTEDVFIATSNNPTVIGSTDVIPLHCKAPCKALFWVAQDTETIINRNFSNYTTNRDDLFQGWNPCSVIDLKYGGAYRLEKMSHEHFDLSEPWDNFPSAPCEPGYNGLAIGYEQTTLNADTALVFDPLNASIHIKVADTDPFRSIDEPEEEYAEDGEVIPSEVLDDTPGSNKQRSKYLIHVRALVYKKLIMTWNEKEKCLKYILMDDATKDGIKEQPELKI